MFAYIWPMALLLLSNTVYQICAKAVPEDISPFASLTVTYLVAAAASTVLFFTLHRGSSLPEENSPGMEKSARKERAGRASRPVRAPHISGKEAADAHEPASQNEKSAPFARKNGSVRQERPSRTEHFEKTERTGRRSYRPFRNRGQKQSGGGKTEG